LVGFDFFTFLEEDDVTPPADCLVVAGERDQFSDPVKLERLASKLGAELRLLAGADHFIFGREHEVAEIVARHWSGP
jgi:alpha/beta superfamily hydrolase